MLNIINPEEMNPIFTQLIADFRRTQVSRFPITVTARNSGALIVFEDNRFPAKNTKVENVVGTLRDAGLDKNNKQTYEVRSRLINNEKYASHNDDYFSRTTNDPKKVSKFLKDYSSRSHQQRLQSSQLEGLRTMMTSGVMSSDGSYEM